MTRLLKIESIGLASTALAVAFLLGPLELEAAASVAILLVTALAAFGAGRWRRKNTSASLDDPLTGLGNRQRLTDDLARVESATNLLLLDLEGFRQHNDTFGQPAGDALLGRLGRRLAATVEGRGRAYRLDGDGFALLTPASADLDALAAEAARALTETGDGFTVGCVYGSARIPLEAADAAEALRLAHRRLHVARQASSSSPGRQISDVLLQALRERYPSKHDDLYGVAEIAAAVAERLNIPAEEALQIRQAGELHDVGKIAVPDAILEKPGALDDDEWEYVRQHPIVGERIIAAAPALGAAARLVRSSHERWDGTGYPDGLVGNEIPLGSRIIMICDAFNAMMAARPYRRDISEEMAFEQLRRCAGSQFDPELVRLFFAVHAELRTPEPAALAS